MKKILGPGALVAAAFIGPGTVTTCTVAGAKFGFGLLWVMVLATMAAISLQMMAVRLGLGARMGLAQAIISAAHFPVLKWVTRLLIVFAIGLGNVAYESGNLSGAALGVHAFIDHTEPSISRGLVLGLASLAAILLLYGQYKTIETLLVFMVIFMAFAFTTSAVIVGPNLGALMNGLQPHIPEGGLWTALALVGTTIVPYNLFLHSSAVQERWPKSSPEVLRQAQLDTGISIGLGGLISALILITSAASLFENHFNVSNALDMAKAIEPLYGELAKYIIGLGLIAAGLSSAITAPLATAYTLTDIFSARFNVDPKTIFRVISLATLGIGTIPAILEVKPISLILLAQIANAALLPIVTAGLLVAMNRRKLLGNQTNGIWSNALGGLVVIITSVISFRVLATVLAAW